MNIHKAFVAFVLTLLGACGSAASRAFGEPPAVHGMLVFGTGTIYFSHLPMFHSPHDYQAILEVKLSGAAGPEAVFMADKRRSGETVYTFVPEPFVLPRRVHVGASFSGVLYRSHFERGGAPIAENVTATVARVVYFRKLEPGAPRPAVQEYLLFGGYGDLYLAHLIWAAPDFDQILSVRTGAPLPTSETARGEVAAFTDLKEEQPLAPEAIVWADLAAGRVRLAVGQEWYRETSDLE